MKSGPWLYRPEPSTIAYNNVTTTSITAQNTTQTTYSLEAYDQNNDVLMRSAFSHFYQMDKIGVFRSFFGLAFPIILIIVMALVLTNVLNYILFKVGLESLQMGTGKRFRSLLRFCVKKDICFSVFFYPVSISFSFRG